MFSRILVPVELSEKDVRAVDAARELASGPGAEVTLLHVIETLDLPFDELEDFYAKLEERAKAVVDVLAARLSEAGVAVASRIEFGARVPEILACARECEAELVVLVARTVDPGHPAGAWSGIAYQTSILLPGAVLLLK
ncbi:MAG: universal stress protein [Gemmatimonadota bacterium]|jgi:nucleotide-binding universal stress UspA family protein